MLFCIQEFFILDGELHWWCSWCQCWIALLQTWFFDELFRVTFSRQRIFRCAWSSFQVMRWCFLVMLHQLVSRASAVGLMKRCYLPLMFVQRKANAQNWTQLCWCTNIILILDVPAVALCYDAAPDFISLSRCTHRDWMMFLLSSSIVLLMCTSS